MSPSDKVFITTAQPGPAVLLVGVAERELRTTNGRSRLTMVLQDKTGRVDAILWDSAVEAFTELAPGDVIEVTGNLGEYGGKPQFTVSGYRLLGPGEYFIGWVMPSSKHDPAEMFKSLMAAVTTKVENRFIGELLEHMLLVYREDLLISAAAMKVHHAFAAGLLEHILSMALAATLLCRNYPRLDQSLMLAGCILHDVGKLRELRTGITIDYTAEGTLLGHVQIGCQMLDEAVLAFNQSVALRPESEGRDLFPRHLHLKIKHMILSHHGQREYGAAVLPMTPEAIALHAIDKLDANLETAWRELDGAAGEDFTPYVQSMERRLYRGDKFEGVA